MDINTYNLKMTGLKNAAHATKYLTGVYGRLKVQVGYDPANGNVLTSIIAGDTDVLYNNPAIINCGKIHKPTTMQDIADRIYIKVQTIVAREMQQYFVGDEPFATLDDAKAAAEEGLSYTQQPVKIINLATGEVAAELPWWGVPPTEDDVVTAQFGDYGFYGEWIDY
jgi:hypothetical protein